MYAVEQAPQELSFGRQGESNILSYAFDFTEWAENWPGGETTMTVTLPNQTQAQPIPAEQAVVDGTVITLHVLDNLTAKEGRGTLIIRYVAGPNKKRSRAIEFTVDKGHDTALGAEPQPVIDWINRFNLLYDIAGTRQTSTLNPDGTVAMIVHTNIETGEAMRTDTIVYNGNLITQTRTLHAGEGITITTNIETMEQSII